MKTLENTTPDLEIYLPAGFRAAGDLPWNPHPKFPGVALRHLITAADTNGQFSIHLVRVDPGCVLDHHVHATQWETHQVLQGSGLCTVGEQRIDYRPGCIAAIPQGFDHCVQAGADGLVLLATFCPPLL